jgi:hypothetical protein
MSTKEQGSFQERAADVARPLFPEDGPRVVDGMLTVGRPDEFERQIFKNLVDRTSYVFDQRQLRREGEKPQKDTTISTIRVACISPEITAEYPGAELRAFKFRDQCSLLQATHDHDPIRWEDERKAELRTALARKPDIICFSELAYPPPPAFEQTAWISDTMRDSVSRRHEFEEIVKWELERKKSDAFVFLGSYHCTMTLYSVGVIYPCGHRTEDIDAKVIGKRLNDEKYHPKPYAMKQPINYRKRFPARRVGEETRVPAGREFNIFEREFANIGVMICSDTVDLNQFMSIIRQNGPSERYSPVDILLIPSFNDSPALPDMCRELSAVAATTVILVNANHRAKKPKPRGRAFPKTELFCCGLSTSDLGEVDDIKQPLSPGGKREPLVTRVVRPVVHTQENRRSTIIEFDINFTGVNWLRTELKTKLQRDVAPSDVPQPNVAQAPI